MSALLTLDSLTARTPDGRILFDGLTLSLGAERVGLVGRNGSGKSTLLSIIAGATAPARGSVTLGGRVGTMLQDPPEAWSVAEALGMADDVARLARIVAGEGSEDDLAEADWTLEGRMRARDPGDRRLAQGLDMLSSPDAAGWRRLSAAGQFR